MNEAGLAGEELLEIYTISLLIPDAPVIKPENGTYEYSKQIEVEVPEGGVVYYTTDGSTPDKVQKSTVRQSRCQ